jgi:hypothetical protein
MALEGKFVMLPNFLIIGSQKSGTTSLYNVLRQHPQVFMPDRKEVNFFFLEAEYQRGPDYYQSYFASVPTQSIAVGEASPGYICHPDAPARIHQLLPDVKLILTVRNPIDRAYSQYWDNRRSLSEHRTFAEVVKLALEPTYHPGRLGYFSRGTYLQYIQRYLDYYPPENLLILPFDDLRHSPGSFYGRIFHFLAIDPDFYTPAMTTSFNPAAVWENPLYQWFFSKPSRTRWLPPRLRRFTFFGPRIPWQYPPMEPELHHKLLEFYRPWNTKLGEFLGRNLTTWES